MFLPVDTLEELLELLWMENRKGRLGVILFLAEWCRPCSKVSSVVDPFTREYKDKVTFFKVDVDVNKSASKFFRIEAVPTFLFIRGGKVIDSVVGADYEMFSKSFFINLKNT